MAKLTKKQKENQTKIEAGQTYNLADASALIKEVSNVNFDPSVDIAVRLNVDPRKANQMVRGVVTLPHGTGKDVKVLALVTPDKAAEAQEAGADYVGLDEYLEKIKGGWTDVDVIITMPSVMGKLGPLGRVLGPRGLMPSFDDEKIAGNARELITTLVKLKPTTAKGVYIKSIFMSSTMSPSVEVDAKRFATD